jgi:hypothetical protein
MAAHPQHEAALVAERAVDLAAAADSMVVVAADSTAAVTGKDRSFPHVTPDFGGNPHKARLLRQTSFVRVGVKLGTKGLRD